MTTGFVLGLALVSALMGGYLAHWLRAPRVIGYLVAGLALQVAARHAFGPEQAAELSRPLVLITDLTLGLILFTIGGVFEARRMKATRVTLPRISCLEIGLSGTFTALGCAAAAWTIPGMTLPLSLTVGLLLGAAAVATAPAATYLVLHEYEAKGPTTDHLLGLVGLNNLVSIIGFFAVLLTCSWLGWIRMSGTESAPLWVDLLLVSVGSILFGVLLGLGLSFLHARLPLPELILVFFAILFLLTTGDDYLREELGAAFSPMVTALVMGAVFENLALDPRRFEQTLEAVSMPMFAVFFVLAGYNLHLEMLPAMKWLGVVYILARALGKLLGVWLGVRRYGTGVQVGGYAGLGLLCQAGVAIGLGASLQQFWHHELARTINTVILAAVAVYELAGPMLVKFVVVRSGEVKVSTLLRSALPALRSGPAVVLWQKILAFLPGRSERTPAPHALNAKLLMRTNVRCLPGNATLDEVLRFVERSRLHDFPVVDADRRLIGVLHFDRLRNLIYEPTFAHLVTAADLADELCPIALPETPLSDLMELFDQHNLGAIPVVEDPTGRRLAGLVEQRDALHALHRHRPVPVAAEERQGVLIVGAGPVARLLGHELAASQSVKLIDTNGENCTIARGQGLDALQCNALHEEGMQLAGGHLTRALIAMTPNDEVNLLAANLARETFRVPEVQVLWSQHPERAHELAAGGRSMLKAPINLSEWDLLALRGQIERVGIEIGETAVMGAVMAKLAREEFKPLPLAVIRESKAIVLHEHLKLQPGDELVALRRKPAVEV